MCVWEREWERECVGERERKIDRESNKHTHVETGCHPHATCVLKPFTVTMRTECERDECAFALVAWTARWEFLGFQPIAGLHTRVNCMAKKKARTHAHTLWLEMMP